MPPADGSSKVAKNRGGPRTAPQSAHLWWPAVAKRAYGLGSYAVGQTDGRIAVFQNAP